MKNYKNYAPIIGILVILYCDSAFTIFFLTDNWYDILLVAVYNLLAFMSLWSLMMAMCKDPGFVPKECIYDKTKLSKTV